MTTFQDTTQVTPSADGNYEGNVDPRWWVIRGPHGGYLCAMILRAITEAVGRPDRPVRSLTAHFIAPPKEGPVEIAVKIERDGRSISYASARLMQKGETMALALAAFSRSWSGVAYDYADPPEIAPPDECLNLPNEGPMLPTFLGNFDTRWGIGPIPYSGEEDTTIGGWIRLAEPQALDAPAVACMLDAWAPAILPRATEPIVAPTVDITMHFRSGLPLPEASEDDFYLFQMRSRLARDGLFEEDGDLWTPSGELIAQVRQMAIALPIKQ
ncbi:MAG TPA: thioesterase family protein [Actinomycetota bacterium]|nr:thioesterase family protein [Actinomycetota bacterium]